jgi:release factor glutamine methyltransferase
MGYDQKKPLEKYMQKLPIKSLEFYQDYEKFDRGFTLELKL